MDTVRHASTVTCTNCGSADVHMDFVRSAFWQDDRLVVVEDIPALVCDACAERSYDDHTIVALDLLRSRGFPPEDARRELRVPVYSFVDKPAAKSPP